MNVSLGSALSDYEPVPLKDFGSDGSPISTSDIEMGMEIEEKVKVNVDVLQEGISVLQVTIRRPFTVASIMAILWSLFPYVVPLFVILSFMRNLVGAIIDNTSPFAGHAGFLLFFILLAIFGVLLNEHVLKKMFQEPRPAASASKSYGMPSGHSTNCYAWMTWSILEMLVTPGGSKAFITFLVIFDLLVLGPVPYARVYLQDHTTKQVVVGSSIGAAIGILAVPVRYAIFPHAVPLWI
jgi:acid phosphatase family membrane protein YuiD